MSRPLRLAVYGSCQAEALTARLRADADPSRLEVLVLPACMHVTSAAMDALVAQAATFDLFVYQSVSSDYRGEEFASARLVEALRPDALAVSVGYYHFEPYTPFVSSPPEGAGEPPSTYFDFHLAALVAGGADASDALTGLRRDPGLAPYAGQMIEVAIAGIRERDDRVDEAGRATDIRLSERVEAAWRRRRVGHTLNHPCNLVYDWILDELQTRVSARFGAPPPMRAKSVHVDEYDFSPSAFAFDLFGLTFREPFQVRRGGSAFDLAAYVDWVWPYYAALDRDRLREHLRAASRPEGRPWFRPLAEIAGA